MKTKLLFLFTTFLCSIMSYGQGAPATHLNFDGVDDVVKCGSSITTALVGATVISVEAMVKPSNNSDYQLILGNYDDGDDESYTEQFSLEIDGDVYSFYIDDDEDYYEVYVEGSVITGVWQHIAAVWDGLTIKLYIDGELKAEIDAEGLGFPAITNDFNIGADASGSTDFFEGDIDEVRIWNKVLTQSEISSRMNCELVGDEEGLLRYYKFNQGTNEADNTSESMLTDSSSAANHGTLTDFALTGTTSNWGSGSDVITGSNCSVLAVNELAEVATVSISPNPTNGLVTINVANGASSKLQILDLTGKILVDKILQERTSEVNIENLSAGVYLFKIKTATGETVKRIIKE